MKMSPVLELNSIQVKRNIKDERNTRDENETEITEEI